MSEKSIDKEELLLYNRLKNGEGLAFKQLFDIYYRRLVAFANTMLADLDLSRGIVQDLFVMLYEKRNELNIHTSLKSHLFQSVRNRCLNVIKHEKIKNIHHQRIYENGSELELPFESLEYNELENLIIKIVERLPSECNKIFKMSRYDGLTNQEIAEKLSISKRTVETQISKALKRMREELAKSNLLDNIRFLSAGTIVLWIIGYTIHF